MWGHCTGKRPFIAADQLSPRDVFSLNLPSNLTLHTFVDISKWYHGVNFKQIQDNLPISDACKRPGKKSIDVREGGGVYLI